MKTDDMQRSNVGKQPMGNATQALPSFCACQRGLSCCRALSHCPEER